MSDEYVLAKVLESLRLPSNAAKSEIVMSILRKKTWNFPKSRDEINLMIGRYFDLLAGQKKTEPVLIEKKRKKRPARIASVKGAWDETSRRVEILPEGARAHMREIIGRW